MSDHEDVAALLDKMAEENERRKWWMRETVRQDGKLVMRNCATGEVVTIDLPRQREQPVPRRARSR